MSHKISEEKNEDRAFENKTSMTRKYCRGRLSMSAAVLR